MEEWEIKQNDDLDTLLTKIKLCPFCGRIGQLSSLFDERGYSTGYYICCPNPSCCARLKPELTANLALLLWNERSI